MASQPYIFGAPFGCPICGLSTVERVFADFTMVVKGPTEDKTVRALAAFICTVHGHIFFVRQQDLPTAYF
jgi:hypothetical protein